ncbi:MAG: class I SAM-dependent methyltransferase [Coleofasciculus sp. B1-GNL1-01]|uniref:class I SAM-dependent methyltransferase n=1 Tax=Coleofasciculus sp. B1-GNL1-01 TaxID=3068484 RepID=UPI0032FD45F2
MIEWDRVAELYDIYVHSDIDISFFIRETCNVSGQILELMAGTGRVSIPLLEAGVSLVCVDASAQILAVLQKKLVQKGLSARIQRADVRELNLQECFDLAIIPFNSFSELLSKKDQESTLQSIHNHLREGGRLICTLHNPNVRLKLVDGSLRLEGTYSLEKQQLLFWGLEKQQSNHCIVDRTQFYEIYDHHGFLQSKRLLNMQFCLIQKQDFEEMAQKAGYKIVAVYGDYSYSEFNSETSPSMIFILQKGCHSNS